MPRYRKKGHRDIFVEALQLTEDNVDTLANWTQAQIVEEMDALTHEVSEGLNIKTPNGKKRASQGMYVVKHGGYFYVSNPGAFEAQYDLWG